MKQNSLSRSVKNNRGMTLMEILIVLGIIASLFAMLIPRITENLGKSKVQETRIIIGQVMNYINMYYTDCGKFPESLDALITADASCSNWGPEPYTKKLPKDAWQREFQYSAEGAGFVIKSLGADGKEGGDGNSKDISSEDIQ
jgi:general secretion pathway protein G